MSSPSQAASQAVRKLLREIGKQYDLSRGFKPFSDNKSKFDLILFFEYKCCYCNENLNNKQWDKDHLVPMNKDHAGLHAWGNIALSCKQCNNQRQSLDWVDFLKIKSQSEEEFIARRSKIERLIKKYNYCLSDDQKAHIQKQASELHTSVFSFVSEEIKTKLLEGIKIF